MEFRVQSFGIGVTGRNLGGMKSELKFLYRSRSQNPNFQDSFFQVIISFMNILKLLFFEYELISNSLDIVNQVQFFFLFFFHLYGLLEDKMVF